MNMKQSYFDFLAAQGAKEKVQAIIDKEIAEWKNERAYKWKPTVNDFGDTSGELYQMFDKGKALTIGDTCKTDIEVLLAYSGRSEATYCSGCGLRYTKVSEEISWNINKCLGGLRSEWILKHRDELLEGQNQDPVGEEWEDEDYIEYIDEHVLDGEYLNYEWMQQEFPQYIYQEDDIPMGPELLFDIDD